MSVAFLILAKLAGIGVLYLALAAAVTARAPRRQPSPSRALPSVTILKPLHGAEPGLTENLLSFARQTYGSPVQIVAGVQHPADLAIAAVREVQTQAGEGSIELVIDARQHGTNRKVANLLNMSPAIRHELVVVADSDIRVPPDYLARIAAEFEDPRVGAVTCPYHGVPVQSVWARLAGLAIDTHFTPGALMGAGLGIGHPCMGSTIALRRETLEGIGGFRVLADELADDHALGARVRALGLRVVVAPFSVGHVCPERSLAALVRQELRWQRTIRQVEPVGHLASALAHPLPFALAALVAWPGAVAAALVGTALTARLGLCLAVERAFRVRRHPYWLIPARDLLSFALFVASFGGRDVSWRGFHYRAAPGGALVPQRRA